MTSISVLHSAGRRRSPATMPGYHAGRPPRNKGIHYPADPPTVDGIVAVMRHTAENRHGWRLRAMIVSLWRAGLGVQEALALAEHAWTRGEDRSWCAAARAPAPRGRDGRLGLGGATPVVGRAHGAACRPVVLHHRWPDPGAAMVERRGAHRVSASCGPRLRSAAVRAPISSATPTPSSSPTRACLSMSSSGNSATRTWGRRRSICRGSTRRRSSPPCGRGGRR
jgi:hypothetical protein